MKATGKAHPVGSGQCAHGWAHVLRDLVRQRDIVVPDPGTEHGRRLVRALGAKIK